MAFTDDQKNQIRMHTGYGVYGSESNPNYGYRYFTWFGTLEYKMNNLAPVEEATVLTVFLPRLNDLQTAIFDQTTQNADTDRAAVWYHNKNEQADREKLYMSLRLKLCAYFRVPFGEWVWGVPTSAMSISV